jgi:hypothetical protein
MNATTLNLARKGRVEMAIRDFKLKGLSRLDEELLEKMIFLSRPKLKTQGLESVPNRTTDGKTIVRTSTT